MKLYHNFEVKVDNEVDWDDYLFVVNDNNKKKKRIDEWEQEC